MFRRTLVGLLLVLIAVAPARAQFVVIDPANLTQTILIAERTWQHYQELRRQYETILRMSRGLGNMELAVATARRGWATTADVVNTRPLEQVLRR